MPFRFPDWAPVSGAIFGQTSAALGYFYALGVVAHPNGSDTKGDEPITRAALQSFGDVVARLGSAH